MEPHFNQVTIIGAGLLGSSLGLALKSQGQAECIVGVGRRQQTLDTALAMGAIDHASLDPALAVAQADLVVIATPAALVTGMLDAIQAACPAHAIVTDVASTKQAICRHARERWPAPCRFIGSHPMAGSEKFGPEHGRADFYRGSVCLVEKDGAADPAARDLVVRLWESVGARVVDIDPEQHDLLLAYTSHIPHVLSAAIAELAVAQGDVKQVIGNGFRDMTRIAASRPEVWRDICLTNRAAMLEGIDAFQRYLEAFSQALEADNAESVEAFFRRGNAARARSVEP